MSLPENSELDALASLTESDGWRLLREWYEKEWGVGAFGAKVARAVGDPTLEPQHAVALLQQTTVARQAVEGLIEWPARRLAAIRAERQAQLAGPSMSRRGPGL